MKKYKTKIEILLTPIWKNDPPLVSIKFSENIFFKEYLTKQKNYCFDTELPAGEYTVIINFLNKKNTDTTDSYDKAIKIDKIILNGIESENFVWEGVYEPIYPEPWATQQKNLGNNLKPTVKLATYLGWNGQWRLKYSAPIFSWIHKIENLGWIYH